MSLREEAKGWVEVTKEDLTQTEKRVNVQLAELRKTTQDLQR